MLIFAGKIWVQGNTAVSYDDIAVSGHKSAGKQTGTSVFVFDTVVPGYVFTGL